MNVAFSALLIVFAHAKKGRYTKELTDTPSNDTSHRLKKALHKSGGTKLGG